jgi:hypothetical protein
VVDPVFSSSWFGRAKTKKAEEGSTTEDTEDTEERQKKGEQVEEKTGPEHGASGRACQRSGATED